MKTKIVYALVIPSHDTFFEQLWASIYSLRLYEHDREVLVCCDIQTASRINKYPQLRKLITEVRVIPSKTGYNDMQCSRDIKTNLRALVEGNFLYVDSDTIFTGTLEGIDCLMYDVAAVPEFHVPLAKYIYKEAYVNKVKEIFGADISDAERLHNGGVIYAADTPIAHEFYKRWHENWEYASNKKLTPADQPPLIKTDMDMGYIVQELPGIYNCQLAMSVEHFYNAKIIHFIHFNLLPMPNNPFLDRSIYEKIREKGDITPEISEIIRNCKSMFVSPSAIVDGKTIEFLVSNPGVFFLRVAREGGILLSLMNKFAGLISRWYNIKDRFKNR